MEIHYWINTFKFTIWWKKNGCLLSIELTCLPDFVIFVCLSLTEVLPLDALVTLTIHLFMNRFSWTGSHSILKYHRCIGIHSHAHKQQLLLLFFAQEAQDSFLNRLNPEHIVNLSSGQLTFSCSDGPSMFLSDQKEMSQTLSQKTVYHCAAHVT